MMPALAARFSLLLPAMAAISACPAPAQTRSMLTEAIEQAVSSAAREPRVTITRAEFSSGCPNPADPTGQADSTCALLNAIKAAEADTLHGAGYPVVYIPHGRYRVSGEGYHAALALSSGVSFIGDGAQSTVIYNASPRAALLTYRKAQGNCNGKAGACLILIHGITFAGAGQAGTGGLIEIDSTDTGILSDVVLANTGGIALNLQGSSERWIVSQVEINNSRWPLVAEGDTNENYFDRVNVLTPGQDADGYCWSVNCPGGKLISSGVWLPDPHSAVFLDGDNLHWMNSSVKDTARMGGMRLAPTTSSVAHTYFEGFPFAHQPRTNHAVEVGGKMELGHLTRAVGADEMIFPVDDAAWQPLYVNDPADIHANDTHSYVNAYTIYPADYQWQSSEPSRAVEGITRGTSERVVVASFAGDGNAYLLARARDGSRAIAWPAGSVIEQAPPRGYGVARIEESHFNSLFADSSKYAPGCSDTAQRTQWTSSPSRLCAEIIAGLVPDGYGVPFPSQGYNAPPFTLDIESNSIYTQDELSGGGWIKIPADAELILNQGNQPLTHFADPASALTTYSNDNTRVQVVNWGTRTALAHVHDLAAGVEFSPQDHYYAAEVLVNGSLSHQYIGDPCWYDGAHTSRFCIHASGATQERLTNGRWVAFAAGAAPASLASGTMPGTMPPPTRYAIRDWSPGTLAPRGLPGDCARTSESTGSLEMSTDPEATLIVNMTPSAGANVLVSGSVPGANTVAVEVCNQAPVAQTLRGSPTILFTQLPPGPLLSAGASR